MVVVCHLRRYEIIDTFVTTNNVELIKKNKTIRQRILRDTKTKHKDLDILFKNIYIEGQYGNTNY